MGEIRGHRTAETSGEGNPEPPVATLPVQRPRPLQRLVQVCREPRGTGVHTQDADENKDIRDLVVAYLEHPPVVGWRQFPVHGMGP